MYRRRVTSAEDATVCWRGELALPIHLGRLEMPHGGWTETVDSTEIDLAATIRRIRDLAAMSQ